MVLECKDDDDKGDCKRWKEDGYCESSQYMSYVQLNCKKTCKTCRMK